jgi:hypothetical protein
MVGFQQAAIRIGREKEFEELKGAVRRAFGPGKVEEFLKRLRSKSVRIRDFDRVLSSGVLEQVDKTLAKSGATGPTLYQALTLSDQGQMREFYLFQVEQLEPALRARFQKLYRYY